MLRHYNDYIQEISKEDLFKGLLGFGLFNEKMPPFLTSMKFLDFCVENSENDYFKEKNGRGKSVFPAKDFIRYENMRNINIPRQMAIPHPIVYRNLCVNLSDHWKSLQEHFSNKTKGQAHKISRIHIRKLRDKMHLFEMGYENFQKDEDPIPDLSIGKKIVVKADISNCFPSIYTHALPWALVGKEKAKEDRKPENWFNQIDKSVRNLKYGETHGILIGPHASSLISEIILVTVDKELYEKGYRYIRNIDDYTCYVESHQQADQFLLDLSSELKKYELTLNHRKTERLKLPLASTAHWVRKLTSVYFSGDVKNHIKSLKPTSHKILPSEPEKDILTFKELRSYLDLAIDLMDKHFNNAAIINYAIKVISKKYLGSMAKAYYLKNIHNLILIYPYLIPLLDEYIFKAFEIENRQIKKISQNIFNLGKRERLWEPLGYALFFSLKYGFSLEVGDLSKIAEESEDCVLMLLAFLYEKKQDNTKANQYAMLSKRLRDSNFDRYWLFVYETSTETELDETFRKLKTKGVSFIKEEFQVKS